MNLDFRKRILQVWERWVTRLGDNLCLVSIDLPGQGLSDSRPRDDYSVAALGSLITEVTSALQIERFSIAGHSMSGALTWRYALAHPDRVEKIVLVAAGGAAIGAPNQPFGAPSLVHSISDRNSWGRLVSAGPTEIAV